MGKGREKGKEEGRGKEEGKGEREKGQERQWQSQDVLPKQTNKKVSESKGVYFPFLWPLRSGNLRVHLPNTLQKSQGSLQLLMGNIFTLLLLFCPLFVVPCCLETR